MQDGNTGGTPGHRLMGSSDNKVFYHWFDTPGVNNRTNNRNIDPSPDNDVAATILGPMEIRSYRELRHCCKENKLGRAGLVDLFFSFCYYRCSGYVYTGPDRNRFEPNWTGSASVYTGLVWNWSGTDPNGSKIGPAEK